MIKLLNMGPNPALFMYMGQFLGTLRHFEQAPEDQKFGRGASLLGPLTYFQQLVDGHNKFGFSPPVLQQMGDMTRILVEAQPGQRPMLPGEDRELMALGAALRRELIDALPEGFHRSVESVRQLDSTAMASVAQQAKRFNTTPPRQVEAFDVSGLNHDGLVEAYFSGKIDIETFKTNEVLQRKVMELSLRYDRLLGGPSALIPLEVIQTFPSIFPLPPPTVRQALLDSLQRAGNPYGHVKDKNLLLNRAENFLALLTSIGSTSPMSAVVDVINQSGMSLAARQVLIAGWLSICAIDYKDDPSFATQVSAILESDPIFGVMGFREKIADFLQLGEKSVADDGGGGVEPDDDDDEVIDVGNAVDIADLQQRLGDMTAERDGRLTKDQVTEAVTAAEEKLVEALAGAMKVYLEREGLPPLLPFGGTAAGFEASLGVVVSTFGNLTREAQSLKEKNNEEINAKIRAAVDLVENQLNQRIAALESEKEQLETRPTSDARDGDVRAAVAAREREMQADIDELKQELARVKLVAAEVEGLRELLASAPDVLEFEALEDEVRRLRVVLRKAMGKNDNLANALVQEIDILQGYLMNARRAVQDYPKAQAMERLLEQVQSLGKRANITPDAVLALEHEVHELRSCVKITPEALATLRRELTEARNKATRLQGEVDGLIHKSSERSKGKLGVRVSELERELEAKRVELEALQSPESAGAKAQARVSELERELETKTQTLIAAQADVVGLNESLRVAKDAFAEVSVLQQASQRSRRAS